MHDLFEKTKSVLHPDICSKERIAVIGIGSGGSRVSEELARFNVGCIALIDKPGETLEEHNIIRHALGHSWRGCLKIEGMEDRLHDINPACEIQTSELDVMQDTIALKSALSNFDCTQILLCTDNEPSKHVVNALAVELGIPLIFAGVFDGGIGGEVGRIKPGDACYACMAHYLKRKISFEEQEPSIDYSKPESEAEAPSTAALNIDIAQIALIQARVCLLTILAKTDPSQDFDGNYILFGNRPVEGLFPRMLFSDIWTIKKDDQCMICNKRFTPDELEHRLEAVLGDITTKEEV